MPPLSHIRHLLVVVVVVAATLVASATVAPSASAEATAGEHQVAQQVNAYRAAHGKPPLRVDAGMSADARAWSATMTRTGLDHDPGYTRSCDRFPGHRSCAENVGYSSSGAQSVQSSFEGSAGHRSNLLCDCTHIGVGIATSGGRTYVTERFVNGGAAATASTGHAEAAPAPAAPSPFVRAAYEDFLGRGPSTGELAHWSARVGSAGARAAFVRSLAHSPEWVGALVDAAYRDALDRAPDAPGRRHWVDRIIHGASTPAEVVSSLYASPEHFADRAGNLRRWVDGLYGELIGRSADATGRAHWVAVASARGRHAVSASLYDSLEARRARVDRLYHDLLGRAADVRGRDHWAAELARTGSDVVLARSLATSAEYLARADRRF